MRQSQQKIIHNQKRMNIVITGGNLGMGYETAKALYNDGHNVIFGSRNTEKNQKAVKEISKQKGGYINGLCLDLSKKASIQNFVEQVKKRFQYLDVLINNASVLSEQKKMSQLGVEMMITTNYLGGFYLTYQCLDLLKKSNKARVINVSSQAYKDASKDVLKDWAFQKKKFSSFSAYMDTKLLYLLFTKGLQDYIKPQHQILVKLIQLGMRVLVFCCMKKPDEGAKTHIYLSTIPFEELKNGSYYDQDQQIKEVEQIGKNSDSVKKLWEMSQKLYDVKFR